MSISLPALLAALILHPTPVSTQTDPPNVQAAVAVLAAPEDQREQARVLGYGADGQLVTLREGENELVCLADDPSRDGLSVACYHESLEPYMARGRELVAHGITDPNERNQVRWQEAEEGTLSMPQEPATLYVLSGSAFDPDSGVLEDAYLRFVIYVPWATEEATGLTDSPLGPGTPWLMYPGTPGAHIMISPPRNRGGS